jgi:cation:H+ antiporter
VGSSYGATEKATIRKSTLQTHIKTVLRDWRLSLILVVVAPILLIGLWLAFDVTVGITLLILGIALLAFSAEKAVEHSVSIASTLGMSPLMIGLIIVSLGTDFPEIMTSIVSSTLGHGDIVVGDAFGSVLAQMTLVLGLLPFFGRGFRVRRDEITVMGACEALALIASVSMVEKGYISLMNAVFLVASWPILMLITKNVMKKPEISPHTSQRLSFHLGVAILGFIGVAGGSFIVIESVIAMSAALHVPEYFISFFVVAIGTSLPELVVDLTAIRKKQYEIAIGDAIGSCLIDAGFSIGIGPLFFAPIKVTGRLAETTGLYALLGSVVVISTLALREKLDKKAGVLFLVLYLLSYAIVYA